MSSRLALSACALIGAFALGVAAKSDEHKTAEKSPALERFKQLVGDWTGKMTDDGKEYKVTSGGSAVVETLGRDTPHEMITMIHADGKDLVLTHYCSAGNQPRMKADGNATGDKFDFQFVDATNLKSDKAMHMHSVVYTLIDKDTLTADWTSYMDGKKAGTAHFTFKRKK
jgi:hypothetical protein